MTDQDPTFSRRQQEILQLAIELIATDGYDNLTMRAVARASGMKLGALQYHFPTRNDLLRALATYIADTYRASVEEYKSALDGSSPNLRLVVEFLMEDDAGSGLHSDRLFPQLWALALVEPIMEDLMDNIYEEYLRLLETILSERGLGDPLAEALAIMALIEGLTLFVGQGRRWAKSDPAATQVVYDLIDQRYGTET